MLLIISSDGLKETQSVTECLVLSIPTNEAVHNLLRCKVLIFLWSLNNLSTDVFEHGKTNKSLIIMEILGKYVTPMAFFKRKTFL